MILKMTGAPTEAPAHTHTILRNSYALTSPVKGIIAFLTHTVGPLADFGTTRS
jgi:hypothetical protein